MGVSHGTREQHVQTLGATSGCLSSAFEALVQSPDSFWALPELGQHFGL
jgi:hypothetical protein